MSKYVTAWAMSLSMLVAGGAAVAQTESPTSAPAEVTAPAVAVAEPGLPASDVEKALEYMYAELEAMKAHDQVSTAKVVAIGSAASAGFFLGNLLSGGLVTPAVGGAAAYVGMPAGVAEGMGNALGAVTVFSSTVGGGVVGDALID